MQKVSPSQSLSAGELAREAGVSTDTLRHYEAKGVIKRPPRRANGYRLYPSETLPRVLLVRRALVIGFTLDELAEILRVRERGGAPCRRVRALAADKLAGVEQRLAELTSLRDELRATLRSWDARLAKTPSHRRSGLLENLNLSPGPEPRRRPQFSTNAKTKTEGKK